VKIFGITTRWVTPTKQEIQKGELLKKRGDFRRLRIGEPGILYMIIWNVICVGPLILDMFLVSMFSDKNFDLIWLAVPLAQLYVGSLFHELMHGIPYWDERERITISLFWKWLFIGGHLSARGAIQYEKYQKSLWLPIAPGIAMGIFALASLPIANPWVTQFFFFASLIIIAAGGVDIYWSCRIRKLGNKAKYYDHGRSLDIVWKEN
jgi:hypothetical protein